MCPFTRSEKVTYTQTRLMGLPYMPTLGPQTTPTDRHLWQSHGVSGIGIGGTVGFDVEKAETFQLLYFSGCIP